MRDFLKSSSFKVLIITVVVLLGLILYTATAGGSFLGSLLGFASAPMQGVTAAVTENVTEFLDLDGLSKGQMRSLVNDLLDRNAQLEQQLAEFENTKQENEQLKTQLSITSQRPENQLVSASVIGRDPNDVFYGFSIDKGTLEGVAVGDPVISSRGLVGVVSQAYATTSLVSCLLSEDVKVAAVCVDTRESGTVTGSVSLAASGLLRLSYLSGNTQVQPGEVIVTSGAGNAYPKDILIGEVQRVEKSENDASRYAVIRPSEDLQHIRDVFVIVDFPGKGEETAGIEVDTDPGGGEDTEQ